VTGPIEEVAAQPWALVLRVPTADGPLYFKEPAREYAHEASVIELLARRRPQVVPELVSSDESGRMLIRDAATWRDLQGSLASSLRLMLDAEDWRGVTQ
jgi:hypothetical protein